MRENRSLWHGNPDQYQNDANYLASAVATESFHGPEGVLQDMYREYNYRPIEAGTWHHTTPVHDSRGIAGEYTIIRD